MGQEFGESMGISFVRLFARPLPRGMGEEHLQSFR
jgi:hypothetical protein